MKDFIKGIQGKRVLIMTVGASNSGKTTWANELIKQYGSGMVNINRDDIRTELFCDGNPLSLVNYKFSKHKENRVTTVAVGLALEAVEAGESFVVSDTNLNVKTRLMWEELAKQHGYEVIYKPFDVDCHVCIARSLKRPYTVPSHIIKEQCKRMREYLGKPVYKPNELLPKAVIFDTDGTLADMTGIRKPYDWHLVGKDKVRENVKNFLTMHHLLGAKIILLSGRDGVCYDDTAKWYKEHGIPYHLHLQREAGDSRPDATIKEEIFFRDIAPFYNVILSVDDRDQMVDRWREIGLECWQVQDGAF